MTPLASSEKILLPPDGEKPASHARMLRIQRSVISVGERHPAASNDNKTANRLASFSGDNEWYTPARYVEMAREVMGGIDTDPASNPTAQRTVGAKTYYTAEINGLDKDWQGRVWMNPPYSNPEIQNFVAKLIEEYTSGRCTEAVVLTNNAADTGWHRAMQDACTRMCTTTGRIRFESPTRKGNSPAMGQWAVTGTVQTGLFCRG